MLPLTMRRIWAVVQKEFIQTFRDRRTLMITLSIPLIELFLFGYAIQMNVSDIPTLVADQSLDGASYAYVTSMRTSGYFDVVGYVADQQAVVAAIDAGLAQAGIVIPPNFAARVARDEAEALFLIDGTDLFTSQSAYHAANLIAQNHTVDLVMEEILASGRVAAEKRLMPLDARVRILYNPNLDDLWFLIPGMLAMLLQVQAVTLMAASIVREREVGTVEALLVTPIRNSELMLGKMLPNVTIAFVNMMTILALGVYWFKVPFQGDIRLFLWLAFMYVFSGLGLGLLVSTVSQNQRQSQQISGMIGLLGVVLGGFIFPRYTMPTPIRLVGNLFPMTYFIQISRSIMTKGVGLAYFWDQVVALLVYIVVVLAIAARIFKRELE